MHLLKHDIVTEFPQHKEKIRSLRSSHPHFATLYDAYDTLNHAIVKAENGSVPMTEETLEIDKKKRLRLKDEIAQMLQQT